MDHQRSGRLVKRAREPVVLQVQTQILAPRLLQFVDQVLRRVYMTYVKRKNACDGEDQERESRRGDGGGFTLLRPIGKHAAE